MLAASGFASSLEGLEFKHGIAFFGDLKYPADYTQLEYLNPDAPKGGTLVLATQSDFNTLAPMPERGTPAPQGFWFTSDTLLIRAGDEVSAFYGRLADGVAITDDRLTMVFRIHPDARWQDEVPITSRDVTYTFDFLKSQTQGGLWYDFLTRVEAIDARHVALHLAAPLTVNNIIMVQFTSILPEHYWRERDPSATTMVPQDMKPWSRGNGSCMGGPAAVPIRTMRDLTTTFSGRSLTGEQTASDTPTPCYCVKERRRGNTWARAAHRLVARDGIERCGERRSHRLYGFLRDLCRTRRCSAAR